MSDEAKKRAADLVREALTLTPLLGQAEPATPRAARVAKDALDKIIPILDEIEEIAEQHPEDSAFKHILDTLAEKRASARWMLAVCNKMLAN